MKKKTKYQWQMFCEKKKLNYTLDWHFKAEIEGRNGDKEAEKQKRKVGKYLGVE